jgi:hypothetical protein
MSTTSLFRFPDNDGFAQTLPWLECSKMNKYQELSRRVQSRGVGHLTDKVGKAPIITFTLQALVTAAMGLVLQFTI